MMEKRRAERRRCDVDGHILAFGDDMANVGCRLVDITEFGAQLHLPVANFVPRRFELLIGTDPLAHPCRLARQIGNGFGIEFLDPIRDAIEAELIESFFQEELLIEMSYGRPLRHSPVRKRLNAMVETMMEIIVERGPAPKRIPRLVE